LAGDEPLIPRIALIGLPGAGKSTVAKLLARRLGFASVDLDREIERLTGRAAPAVLEEEGEEHFRDLESGALAEVLGEERSLVLACGGGVLVRTPNRDLLKARARVVWLKVDPTTAAVRLGPSGGSTRPLLRGGPLEERLEELLESRSTGYADAADLVVNTDGLEPEEVADRIAAHVVESRPRWDRSGS
jgi:shikimate kinase